MRAAIDVRRSTARRRRRFSRSSGREIVCVSWHHDSEHHVPPSTKEEAARADARAADSALPKCDYIAPLPAQRPSHLVCGCGVSPWMCPHRFRLASMEGDATEAKRLRDDAVLANATPEQLARLITVCMRQDRFVKGALESAFTSGLLTRIRERVAGSPPQRKTPTRPNQNRELIGPRGRRWPGLEKIPPLRRHHTWRLGWCPASGKAATPGGSVSPRRWKPWITRFSTISARSLAAKDLLNPP